jgi:hypothetical protein
MNKTFLLVTGILLFAHAAKSQSQFGVKAGVNLANEEKFIGYPDGSSMKQETKPFVGYQLGAFYKAKLHTRLLLAAEANFSVIGSGMKLSTPDGQVVDAHEKLGYIELPLTIQYKLGKIYLGAGPGIGCKVLSKITNFQDGSYKIPYYRTLDASANALAGFSATDKLDVNVRYSHGLMNLYKGGGSAEAKYKFFNLSILYALK